MTVWADVAAFVAVHWAHGPVAATSTPPDSSGYDVDAACPCGAAQSRRVTLEDALADLATEASPPAQG